MLKDLIIGQYWPGNSFVHRLDPRIKIVAVLILVITLLLTDRWPGNALLAIFALMVISLARIPGRSLYRGLRPLRWFILLTFFLHLFFTPGVALALPGPLKMITREGLDNGLLMGFRFLLLIVITALLTLTTSPIKFTVGLERLLRPLRRVGLPVSEMALMMSIALRFIPTMTEEADQIMKAQEARGAVFKSGELKNRLRALLALVIPLLIGSFQRAEELAVAMEARGFHGVEGRSSMQELRAGPLEHLAWIVALMVGAAAIFLNKM